MKLSDLAFVAVVLALSVGAATAVCQYLFPRADLLVLIEETHAKYNGGGR